MIQLLLLSSVPLPADAPRVCRRPRSEALSGHPGSALTFGSVIGPFRKVLDWGWGREGSREAGESQKPEKVPGGALKGTGEDRGLGDSRTALKCWFYGYSSVVRPTGQEMPPLKSAETPSDPKRRWRTVPQGHTGKHLVAGRQRGDGLHCGECSLGKRWRGRACRPRMGQSE